MAQPSILPPQGPVAENASSSTAPSQASTPAGASSTKSTPEVKSLEGKTTIDDKLSIECEILCYMAISKIAEQIAKEFHDYYGKKPEDQRKHVCIIFLDEAFKTALQLQQAFVFQLDLLKKGYKGIHPVEAEEAPRATVPAESYGLLSIATGAAAAAGAGFASASAFGRSVIDLLSLFRTDVSYAGRSVAIKEEPLVLELANMLYQEKWDFLYPRLLTYKPVAPIQASAKHLEELVQGLLDVRGPVEEDIRKFAAAVAKEESELADKLIEAKKTHHEENLHDEIGKRKQDIIPKRLRLEAKRSQFEALDAKLKALQASLITPDVKSGIVPLHLVQQADELLARFRDRTTDTYFLWAEVTSANGSYQIRRNLWGNLFNLDDGLYYSGGAIITYAFFDGNASIVLSGTHRYRERFTQFPRYYGSRTEGNSF